MQKEADLTTFGTHATLDALTGSFPAEHALGTIRSWIENGRLPPGKRLPSERVLAENLKVKRGAVRAAFGMLEREGLILAAPRRSRVVNPSRRRPVAFGLMTRTVVALVQAGFNSPRFGKGHPSWMGRLTQGLMDGFTMAGYGVLFVTEPQVASAGTDPFLVTPPRGLVAVHDVKDLPTVESLRSAMHVGQIPVVAWGSEHDWPECDVVVSDHEQGSRDLVGALLHRGARRLLRCRPKGDSVREWVRQRDRGFETALRAVGAPVLTPLDIPGLDEAGADHAAFDHTAHLLAGYLYRHLNGPEPVEALLAPTDSYVPELAAACRILGRDPAKDILLAGYDNCWSDCEEREWESTPPHVTVDKHDREIGLALAGLLLERLDGKLSDVPQRRLVPQEAIG